jgi:hypothetical protein
MAQSVTSPALDAAIVLLREAFEGPSGPSTYFVDNDRPSGLFQTLETVTPGAASRRLGKSGASIAGHVFHLGFHLDASAAWIRGDREPRDWRKSWSVVEVDDAGWQRLRSGVARQLEDLVRAIEAAPLETEELATIIGAVAHAAYHLGAIRQRLAAERAGA